MFSAKELFIGFAAPLIVSAKRDRGGGSWFRERISRDLANYRKINYQIAKVRQENKKTGKIAEKIMFSKIGEKK